MRSPPADGGREAEWRPADAGLTRIKSSAERRLNFDRHSERGFAMLRRKNTKLTRLLMIALIGWSAVGAEIAPVLAQPPAMQHALTSEARSQLNRSIASMTSLDPRQIEIRTTNAVVLVRLVNTLYNTGPASDRDYLASTIAALVEKDLKRGSAARAGDGAPRAVPQARRLVHEDRR